MGRALLPLLLLLSLGARAVELPDSLAPASTGLSSDTLLELGRLKGQLAASKTARALIAETDGVLLRAQHISGPPIAYRYGPRPFLAFDEAGLSRLSDADAELLLSRELAEAAVAWPLDCPEARQLSRARQAEVALELAASDRGFGRALKALSKARKASPESEDAALPGRGALDEAAADLVLLARGPQSFLWAVEEAVPAGSSPAGLTLSGVEDFIAAHGPSLTSASFDSDGHYAWLGGRPYPAALARAALGLVESGAKGRLDAVMAGFYSPELPELSRRAARWLRR